MRRLSPIPVNNADLSSNLLSSKLAYGASIDTELVQDEDLAFMESFSPSAEWDHAEKRKPKYICTTKKI